MTKEGCGLDPELAEALAWVKPEFCRFENVESWQLAEPCPSCSQQTYHCIFSGILGIGKCTEEKYLHLCRACHHHEFKSTSPGDLESPPPRSCPMCGHAYSGPTSMGRRQDLEGLDRLIDPEVLGERIARRARQLCQSEGRSHTVYLRDWLQAEPEVFAEMGLTKG